MPKKRKPNSVILCGYNWAGCKALKLLLGRGDNVFVYTHRNQSHVPNMIALCERLGVPYSTEKIKKNNLPFLPDVISSVYYRYLIDSEVIESVQNKIFNLHPSLLPLYRGCSSLTWAMIHGEGHIGFSYHYIDSGVDTGNILYQQEVEIEAFDTQRLLYSRVMFVAMEYYLSVLDKVLAGEPGVPQTEPSSSERIYFGRGCPYGGEIDDTWSSDKIERFIRAMIFPPLPYATYRGKEVKSYAEYEQIKNNTTICE